MTDVAIIIINYNTALYTLDCLASIEKQTSQALSYEVVVIDNNSEWDDFKQLQSQFPEKSNYTLHRSMINTGFGGGNMLGAQFANAKYLMFLNNDALLLNDTVGILKTYMDQNAAVALCSAQNYDQDGNFIPSFDHHKDFWRLLFGRNYLQKKDPKTYPTRKIEYTEPLKVNWVNGCLLFFRTTDFEAIGGFDTNIFLYFEEMDLCKRLEQNNKHTYLVPEARIQHYMSKSSGISKRINKEALLSHFYVVQKHYSNSHYKMMQWYYLITLIFKKNKRYLWPVAWHGAKVSRSIKHEQQINFRDSSQ
ncbi:MAG: glycosyltransferase family 2 protein [Marinirhabdus sp.]|nr:glycosyltransferase family 2 protein [Marinirhabdus sp.]